MPNVGMLDMGYAGLVTRGHIVHRKRRHKFNAKAASRDGLRFDSLKERRYYDELKLRVRSGEVDMFLRQVPFHLPGGVRYVVDFQEFRSDGSVHFIDVKGVETKEFKMKKRMVEDLYPVEIEIV